jgi:hypothetical protein
MTYQDETSTACVSYEGTTRTVTVTFRGTGHVLPERYRTQEAGMRAGNDFCRRQGWPHRS